MRWRRAGPPFAHTWSGTSVGRRGPPYGPEPVAGAAVATTGVGAAIGASDNDGSYRLADRPPPRPPLFDRAIARALRVLAISATLLVAVLAGAVAGRALASAFLPELDELSAIADTLVPDEASDVSAHDSPGTGLANVNIFRTPIPSEASRSFTPDGPPEEAVQTIRRERVARGWRASEADDEFRDGRRSVAVNQNVWQVLVAVSYDPGLVSYLPTLTAASAGAAVLAAATRRRRRASRSSRSTAP